MTTHTATPALSDFVLTEREFEDSDVAVLREEVAAMDDREAAEEAWLVAQAERINWQDSAPGRW